MLHLADGEVTPSDLVQHGLAPRIAVLSSNRSGVATDEEGWRSLASALLESGTEVVIATDRHVEDGAARAMMAAFYAQRDWREDPAHALAQTQLAMVADMGKTTTARTAMAWAAFSILYRPPVISPRPRGSASL
jgi:CHAT domain-containing protein